MKNKKIICSLSLLVFLFPAAVFAQLFTPVPITGFNNDVVAETGTSSLTTTTSSLDGVTVSNKVMYSNAFRLLNLFDGGGIPDNGTITDAAGTYQLAAYNANNALIVQRSQNADLTLTTPAGFSIIRILCFSTEGPSLVNVKLTFTDGSSTNALTNYSLGDWFNNTTNLVLSGFGRCTRSTPASGADAFPTNPRFYYIEIPLSCTDRLKSLQKINFANVTTAGNNAPYPNAVFWALSGKSFTQNILPSVTNATCSVNGSATLTVTGTASPYTISWNTVPVQTGPTATNLTPGNYTATITDVNSCVSTYPVTISLTNNLAMNTRLDTTICSGASFTPGIVSNAATYAWSPAAGVSNPAIANPVLSPTVTTTYTVTGTLGTCTVSRTFTVTVNALSMTNPAPVSICSGSSVTPTISSNATSFSWSPATGVSNTTILNPVFSPTITTQYTITGTLGACTVTRNFLVTVLQGVTVNAGPDVSILSGSSVQLQGSGTAGNYLWTPAIGLNATNVLNPTATPTITTTYTLRITTSQGCTNKDDVVVTVIPYCIKPLNAFTPNGDGINDKWLVTNGSCTKNIRVTVFNRYGNKVYESEDYKNDWDGTYKGKPLPDATYYYTIRFVLITNDEVNLNGDVTILR
jgi:gliding motility-associated-like protein